MPIIPAEDIGPAGLTDVDQFCGKPAGTVVGYVLAVEMADGGTGILTNACCVAHACQMASTLIAEAAGRAVPCSSDC